MCVRVCVRVRVSEGKLRTRPPSGLSTGETRVSEEFSLFLNRSCAFHTNDTRAIELGKGLSESTSDGGLNNVPQL